MKKLFLLMLVCEIFFSAFAQPEILKKNNAEVSDKWVITPVSTMKGVLGRLIINFPVGVSWGIEIYQQADNKNISNFSVNTSGNATSQNLTPGEYRIFLKYVPVENVPIKKGHETRLKAGFLNVVSEGSWHLYNETKEKIYVSSSEPYIVALPVGNYQINLGGQFYPVIIKDGETVEDYSPAEIKKDEIPGQVNTKIIENDKWVITPTSESEEGRIVTVFPMTNQGMSQNINYQLMIRRPGESASVFYCRGNSTYLCPETYSLAEGLYDVYFGVAGEEARTINSIIIWNVPVKKGYETRLKVGYLQHKFSGIYQLFDESMQINYHSYNYQFSPIPIPLPVGNYTVNMPNVGNFNIQIKDGIKTVSSATDSFLTKSKWTISPITKFGVNPVNNKGGGRIISQFPGSEYLKFILRVPSAGGTGYTSIVLDTLKYYDIRPGIYTAYLNSVPVEFPVEKGKQTEVRFGYLESLAKWWLQDPFSTKEFGHGDDGLTRAIPTGFYMYVIENGNKKERYLIKINEGLTCMPKTSY